MINRTAFITTVFLAPLAVEAATYNFYLNNAEQGAGSSAVPSVTVGSPEDGSGKSAPVREASAGTKAGAETVAILQPSEPNLMEKLQSRWIRFQGGMQLAATSPKYYGSYGFDTQGSLSGAFSFLPSPHFGLTGFYGEAYGAEMDLIPGITSSGRTEFGLMFGVSRLASRPWMEGVRPHVGTRFTWNVSYPWGVTFAARLAPSYDGYFSFEGGLTFSL